MSKSPRRVFVLPLLAGLLGGLAGGSLCWAQAAVPPGSVVRWPGPDLDACRLDGEAWQPQAEACLYPIDLQRTGSLTLERRQGGTWQQRTVRVGDYPYDVQRLTIQDQTYTDISADNLERINAENRRIGALWGLRTARRFSLPVRGPLADLPKGGRFGSKRIINGESKRPHSGADYAAVTGTPVLAIDDGTVMLAEEHFFAGNSVFIDHGDGLITMYFHLDGLRVEKGDPVLRGQIVGMSGATGRVTGPHLHFGVRWRGARIDPAFLYADPVSLPAVP